MVYPDENMARENATDRIIPMIESTPALSLYRTQNTDDLASLRIKLTHMLINMAWSGIQKPNLAARAWRHAGWLLLKLLM